MSWGHTVDLPYEFLQPCLCIEVSREKVWVVHGPKSCGWSNTAPGSQVLEGLGVYDVLGKTGASLAVSHTLDQRQKFPAGHETLLGVIPISAPIPAFLGPDLASALGSRIDRCLHCVH